MDNQKNKYQIKKITCVVCGIATTQYSIGMHVKKYHDLDPVQYKLDHGITPKPKTQLEKTLSNRLKRVENANFYKASIYQKEIKEIIKGCTEAGYKPWDKHILLVLEHHLDSDYVAKAIEICAYTGKRDESLEYLTILYGEEKAQQMLERKSQRVKGDNNPAYKHNGRYSKWSKNFHKERSEEQYQDDLQDLKNQVCKTKSEIPENVNTRIEHYTSKGMSEEEAKIALSERQTTFNLDKCIERHGEVKGKEIWQARQEKWQNTMKSKSPEEIARINKGKAKGLNLHRHSNISQELFDSFNIEDSRYATHGGEKRFNMPPTFIFVDFLYKNKIIEFNGDLWHANPDLYEANDILKIMENKTAQEIWDKDEARLNYLESQGYDVLVVWEKDYREDKNSVKERCLAFLHK